MLKKGFLMSNREFFVTYHFDDMGMTMLYTYLSFAADIHSGCVEISRNKLAIATHTPERTVRRRLEKLVSLGWIKIDTGANQHMSTKITLLKYLDFHPENHGQPNGQADGQVNGQPNGQADHNVIYEYDLQKECVINDGVTVDGQVGGHPLCNSDGQAEGCSILDKKNKKIKRKYKEKESICNGSAVATEVHSIDPKATAKTAGSRVFLAYSEAYQAAYGQEPVRNAKQNAHCARIVARLGEESALLTTRYYLTHRKRWYVDTGHCLAALEKDCEALDVQRRKGMQMTETLSRQIDKDSALDDVVRRFNERHKGERTSGK